MPMDINGKPTNNTGKKNQHKMSPSTQLFKTASVYDLQMRYGGEKASIGTNQRNRQSVNQPTPFLSHNN